MGRENQMAIMNKQIKLTDILKQAEDFTQRSDIHTALEIIEENIPLYPIFQSNIEDVKRSYLDWLNQSMVANGKTNPIIEKIFDLITEIRNTPPSELCNLLLCEFFPKHLHNVPFGEMLEKLFFENIDSRYPIHGPNVIRFTNALFSNERASGLFRVGSDGTDPRDKYSSHYDRIKKILIEWKEGDSPENERRKREQVQHLLLIAALYHDIGKYIKNPKHPEIGANIIRYYNKKDRQWLTTFLSFGEDRSVDADLMESRQNRFSLLTSIIQHHDKFGVVSTGEGGLPIFSAILYFASSKENAAAIKKNVTSVMLVNLADIAAVNIAGKTKRDRASTIVKDLLILRAESPKNMDVISEEKILVKQLINICEEEDSCLGINDRKIKNVMHDWLELIQSIDDTDGSRLAVKEHLFRKEKNSARSIERIYRIIGESIITAKAEILYSRDYLNRNNVESAVVRILGTYQFQSFCEKLATIVKFDYGLKFFQSIVCACVRKYIYKSEFIKAHHESFALDEKSRRPKNADLLSDEEVKKLAELSFEEKDELVSKITSLVIKTIESIISRYSGIFDLNRNASNLFGIQMGDLSNDNQIWRSIVEQLCLIEEKESFALSWMIDEVTIWPFD